VYFLYNIAIHITHYFLVIIALFNPKIKRFLEGRKTVFTTLEEQGNSSDKTIWIHTASLGEYEQGLPVIKLVKETYPKHKILVTFFSPSGYDVKKHSSEADIVTYLPLDTRSNAHRFINTVKPVLALFVKYEIWPNYLQALKKNSIPTLLISAIFKARQIYFKPYGGFMRKSLGMFSHIFVQDENSIQLLQNIGILHSSLGGDTRFDRVAQIANRDNQLPFMEAFKTDKTCLVAGSTWAEDEALLVPCVNQFSTALKVVFAPHTIKEETIAKLKASIAKKVICYSEIQNQDLADYQVLIIDTIGILTKIYSYANIAYVGGGFATGLHNTLEPAVFGIPVLIGPEYHGFKEASDLVTQKGILVVHNLEDLESKVKRLLDDTKLQKNIGQINAAYIAMNKGASVQILDHIRTLL